MKKHILVLLCISFSLCKSFAQPDAIFIKAGKLFDSENKKMLSGQIIKVSGNRILEVGKNISIPADARTVDLSDYTVLPGLIDPFDEILPQSRPARRSKRSRTKA